RNVRRSMIFPTTALNQIFRDVSPPPQCLPAVGTPPPAKLAGFRHIPLAAHHINTCTRPSRARMKTPGDVSGTSRARVFGKDAGARWLAKHDVKTARPWRGIISFTHLAREGRMTVTIGRRELLAALGGAAAAWPLAARAQQPGKVWRIGYVAGGSRSAACGSYGAFVQGMRELGYVEGKNFVIEWRSVEGRYERFPEIAAELMRLKVDIFVTGVTAALPALQRATTTIPIVMAYSTDPAGNGLVASLVHPGGNITGLAGSSDDSSPKQLELLTAILQNVSRIGLLGNPDTETYSSVLNNAQDAARKVGLSLVPIEARNSREIEDAFAAFAKQRVPAVMVAVDAVFFGQRWRIAELALANRLATMFALRE